MPNKKLQSDSATWRLFCKEPQNKRQVATQLSLALAALLISLAVFASGVNAKDNEDAKALDFSLHWTVEKYVPVVIRRRKDNTLDIQGIFEPKEERLNMELDAHFESPHKENKDREVTPDGLGIGIKLGI